MINIQLQNKNALVCGSSQGIGAATAIEFAELGANVTLMARNEEKLKEILAQLDTSQGQQHGLICADFANTDEVKDKAEHYFSDKEQWHILVNNTGGPSPGPIVDATGQDFMRAFSMHLINNHNLTNILIPLMKNAQYGRVINIVSTSVRVPIPGLGVSNTIRAAVANWAKTIAGELGQFGITVNNVLPGFTQTERLNSLFENRAGSTGMPKSVYQQSIVDKIPLKRLGQAKEIAGMICFLASEAGAYITGESIRIDGGNTPST